MNEHHKYPLITAGQALAEYARERAQDARQASGDLMDGAHAEALAAAWAEALARHERGQADERAANAALRGSTTWTIGWQEGRQVGQAERDTLWEISGDLMRGLGAICTLLPSDVGEEWTVPDPADLLDEELASLAETQALIDTALRAAYRLHKLRLARDGQW